MVKHGNNLYRYGNNLLDDIMGMIDGAGALVVEYRYDAWGGSSGITGTLASTLGKENPFRYRGYTYDEETELCYLCSRSFNPALGRFLNGDAILSRGIINGSLFLYCKNSPICRGDNDGKDSYYIVLNVCNPAVWNNEHGHYDISIISKENPERGYTFSYGPIAEEVDVYSDNSEYPARYTVWLKSDRSEDKPPCSKKKSRFAVPEGEYDKYCVSKLSYCDTGASFLVSFILGGISKLNPSVQKIFDMFQRSQCDVTDELKKTLSRELTPYNP